MYWNLLTIAYVGLFGSTYNWHKYASSSVSNGIRKHCHRSIVSHNTNNPYESGTMITSLCIVLVYATAV